MHFSYIQPLLENADNLEEEDVESLCKLLNTAGARMDHDRAKKQFDAYFARIEELANNKKLTSRIRFVLRTLIDFRKDGWTNRNPKTIAQIRAEAEKKAAEDVANLFADRNPGSGHRSMPSRDQQFQDRRSGGRGNSDGRGSVARVNNGGWANRTGDMSNFGVVQKPSGAPMTFGPRRGKGGLAPWAGKKAENRDANSMSRFSSSGVSGLGSTYSFALLEASGDGGRKQSVDEGSKKAASKAAATVKTPDIVDEEPKRPTKQHAKSKFKGIVTEGFSLLDLKEVEESLKELNADNYHTDLVDVLLTKAWDKKTAEVKTAVDLLMSLLDDGVVTNDQVKSILGAQIEQIPDMSIDVPDHYKNVGHLLGRLIARDTLTFTDVFEFIKPLLDTRARTPPSTKLLLEILKDLKTVECEEVMVAAWKRSELELKDWWPKPEEAKDDAKREDAAKTVNDAVTKWQNMNDMTAITT
ncbi:armadillo-type protein [Phlyctochytrium arcticum]|nr:armadillo-type protein [Phlyctochytrium arcticum]